MWTKRLELNSWLLVRTLLASSEYLVRFCLDLRDTSDLVFYRIFDRNDIFFGRVQLIQDGIKRRRFPAPRRAGDQYHAERFHHR